MYSVRKVKKMGNLFVWEMVIFSVVLFLASGYCIYRNEKIISYLVEMLIVIIAIVLSNDIYASKLKLLIFVGTFFATKLLLLFATILFEIRAFYWARDIAQGKAEKYYKRYNKKKFLKFVSNVRKIEYGPKLMYGEPCRVNQTDKTGIKFDKRGFPIFNVLYEMKLDRKDYKKERKVHFERASKKLYADISKNKALTKKLKLTADEVEKFRKGEVPTRFTWHHNQKSGIMQLVLYKVHSKVHHKGGFSIWGPKEDN